MLPRKFCAELKMPDSVSLLQAFKIWNTRRYTYNFVHFTQTKH